MIADDLAEKRARLVAASELERLRMAGAWRDARLALSPPADPARRTRVRPWVVRAVGYALPVFGYRRLGRALQVAGIGLAIYRAFGSWRDFTGR
ncbi:MAG: hypothetical protein IT520_10445 [Burkholderiales bacterium]|nr:hypothetical protein [Burkholderiales bacterium]